MTGTGIGASIKRVEDQRFLTGNGNYTDDINQAGQVYACAALESNFFSRTLHCDK